jgi:hypothetical protein
MGCTADAGSAPAQLYNKTISLSFVMSSNGVDEQGRPAGGRTTHQTIYVSRQGRIFFRAENRGGRSAETVDRAPETSPAQFHFDGNRLVRTARGPLTSGALNETVSFDPGFQSCTASIETGHESGKIYKWKSLDGRNITATSLAASNPTCSISEGNAFAQ